MTSTWGGQNYGCWREFFQVIWRSSGKTLAIDTIPAYDGPLLCHWPVNTSRNKGHLTFKSYSCFSHHLAKTTRLDHTITRPGSGRVEIRRQVCNCDKFHTGPWAGSICNPTIPPLWMCPTKWTQICVKWYVDSYSLKHWVFIFLHCHWLFFCLLVYRSMLFNTGNRLISPQS